MATWTLASGPRPCAAVLGRFEDGETVCIRVVGEHLLIGGTTGRGKSGVLNATMAELSGRADVVLWGIDMKRGLELAPWRPVLDRLATTADAAHDLLTAANRVLDARADLLAGRHERKWQPTPTAPALVIAVDELAELNDEAMALLERLARLGRALAIVLVAVTQRPSAAVLGSLDARTQMTARIALGVVEPRVGELILGAGRLGAGWRPDRLSGSGYFLVLVPGQHETPRPARAYWLTDQTVRAAAGRPGVERTGPGIGRSRSRPSGAAGSRQRARRCRHGGCRVHDEETFLLKRSEIRAEQERLREQATALRSQDDAEWCRAQLFDLLAAWDAADGAQRTKLLAGLFERIRHRSPFSTRERSSEPKRQADAVARLLADHGHEVEWGRRNYGAQRKLTWNVRLRDGSEVHIARQLEDLGLALPHEAGPAVGRVRVVAVPKEGRHRFFEYVPLELQTGACSNFSDMRTRLEELAAAIRPR